MARGITGQGSKSHPVPEERASVQWGLVGTTVGRSIRVEGQMGIPDVLHYRHQEPRSCPGKGIHGGWGAAGSVWFLATDSASVLKSWNSSNSSLSDCLNGASYSEAKHRWFPSAPGLTVPVPPALRPSGLLSSCLGWVSWSNPALQKWCFLPGRLWIPLQ